MIRSKVWTRAALLVCDVLLLESVFYAAYLWRFHSGQFTNPVGFSPSELFTPSLIVTGYWIALVAWFGLYRFDPLRPRSLTLHHAGKAAAVGALVLFIITFNPQDPLPRTRVVLAAYGLAVFLIIAGNRVGLSTLLRELRMRGISGWKVLVVGTMKRAEELLSYCSAHPELGFRASHGTLTSQLYRLRDIIRAENIEIVLLTPGDSQERQLLRIVRCLRDVPVRVFITSDKYGLLVGEVRSSSFPGHPLIEVRPELLSPVERLFKRLFDAFAASCLLVLSLPLWLVFCILIPLDSPGPPIFSQKRVGRRGHPFTLLKFRSMQYERSSAVVAAWASKDDPRITRIGRFLRSTRLDELPQLINVILGQMSLVGPRPEQIEFVRRFSREIPLYDRRLNVKPGITGWSQVHLKYDSSADQIPIKLRYDFFYIENMSLPLDLKILFMTLFVVLRGEGQ